MEIHAQYWAGLFDGEGNIEIHKKGRHISVNITQKEMPILYLLQSIYEGSVLRSNTCHKWKLCGVAKVRKFLRDIAPYSIIKGREVMLALEYIKGWKDGNLKHTGGPGNSLNPIEEVRRSVIRSSLMKERSKTYAVKNYPWVVSKN